MTADTSFASFARATLIGAGLVLALAPAAFAQEDADTGFPLTLEHKYGSTTIEAVPERVVSVGLLEQDPLLALGVTPVGTTDWWGGYEGAIWPWAQPLLGDEVPTVVGDSQTLDYELITSLDPDVIVGLYSGLSQEQYETLSAIAPTVAQPAGYVDWGISWQELTQTVGDIVGQSDAAAELVAGVEDRFVAIQQEHPEFVGASAVVATPYEGVFVYGPEDVRGRLLASLGLVLPEGLVEAAGAAFGGNISEENVDMLDVDAIIWLDALAAGEGYGGPLYDSLGVSQEGREIHLSSYEDPLGGATSFVTVVSLPYLLDNLVPMLGAAIDGDPATEVPTTAAD